MEQHTYGTPIKVTV